MAKCALTPKRSAEDVSPDRASLLEQALSKFEEAAALPRAESSKALTLYRESAEAYATLIASGVRNGSVYYNLGNAYYRLGDIGRAILAYRRAELYEPHDPELRANLQTARSLRANQIEVPARSRLIENLLFWQAHTSTRGRVVFAAVVFTLAWVFLIARLFAARRWLVGLFLGCIALSAISAASAGRQMHRQRTHPAGVILAQDVVARTGNGESYQPKFEEKLQPGVEFTLLERRGDWLRIRLPNGEQGWIRADTAETL
jgi:tetratricopeptide (TPR) repeat protein